METTKWFVLVALAATSLALVGCGGGDDEANDAPDGSADAGTLCEDPVDLMQPGPDGGPEISTGIETCADLSQHRYAAIQCTDLAEEDCAWCDDGCPSGQICKENWAACYCITPCATDADCADDEACLCGQAGYYPWVTHCVPAGCRTDADCGGFECGVRLDLCGGASGLLCRTEADACHGSAHCDGGFFCTWIDASSRWECHEMWDGCGD